MPPSKRQHLAEQDHVPQVKPTPKTVVSFENPSNAEKGLLKFPIELRDEVLHHFQGVNIYTEAPYHYPILPVEFLKRTDVLRVLSQVCVAYRRVFLPCLWESFNACHESRFGQEGSFFKHAGQTLQRKSEGLMSNPDLAAYILRVHFVVTRYKSATILPKFASLLTRLPNLHTLHILHAHTLISGALKEDFKGIRLPQIRKLIIPGYCHEILKCCPGARGVWCIREDGRKLIRAIGTNCKEVEELRGFQPNEAVMKKIVKCIPNLRVYEILDGYEDVFLKHIGSIAKLDTIIIRPHQPEGRTVREATIKKCVKALKTLPPTTNKRRIFISHECVLERANQNGRQLTGDLTLVTQSNL